jgi:L-iditol 2-dehydrogenase
MSQSAVASRPTEAGGGRRMRIGVMPRAGAIELREVEIPEPGINEVLVRIRATAICTWEQRTFSGQQHNTFPFIGDHVTVGATACGVCHWCRTGRDRVCPRHYAGTSRFGDAWGPGGFAEYKLHPANGVYPIDPATPWEHASLSEPLSCALHTARLLDLRISDDVVVLGAGVMGLMNVVALKKHGARVIVSETDATRLERARAMGADELIDAAATDPVARVRELTGGRGAEHVIAAIGHARANEQGMAMLSERGRFVLFASAHPVTPLSIEPNEMHNRETGVIGSLSSEQVDFYVANRLIGLRQVDLGPLIERTYELAELQAAMEASVAPGTYRMIVRT